MKKILRSIQTLFPFLQDMKFRFKFYILNISGMPHEEDFKAIKLFKPQPNQVFIDIGSNRGDSILSMLRMSNSNIKIIGFEPNPLIFEKLKSYFDENESIVLHNFGLAEENSVHTLYTPFYRKWMFDGLASFMYEVAYDFLKTRFWLYNENKLSIKKNKCQIKKLDDFQLTPYFIKIDVQGYEMKVLKGGIETIKTHTPIMLIEGISEEHIEFLKQFGYEFYRFSNGLLLEGIGALNTFCINRASHPEIKIKPEIKNHSVVNQINKEG